MDVDQSSNHQSDQLELVKKSANEDQISQLESLSVTLQKKT